MFGGYWKSYIVLINNIKILLKVMSCKAKQLQYLYAYFFAII
jgi:hypothetical protein